MLTLVLASGSPRRIELLEAMGVPFLAAKADVDENESGPPSDVVVRLAEKKARAALALYPDKPVLGSDTLVHADGETFGKPKDEQDAFRMLRALSGTHHEVHSGVCLLHDGGCHLKHVCTTVYFVELTDDDIWQYIRSGESFGKAGAYAVQGMGGMFVSRIEGSPSNVIGLPMHMVRSLLMEHGLWKTRG